MVKGYETLVDSGTKVDVNTGMIAAARLQALIESRASGTRIADLMVQMGRIIDAIHSTVPEDGYQGRQQFFIKVTNLAPARGRAHSSLV